MEYKETSKKRGIYIRKIFLYTFFYYPFSEWNRFMISFLLHLTLLVFKWEKFFIAFVREKKKKFFFHSFLSLYYIMCVFFLFLFAFLSKIMVINSYFYNFYFTSLQFLVLLLWYSVRLEGHVFNIKLVYM